MGEPDAKYMPVEVDVASHRDARKVRFAWEDGHQASYPYEYLRGCCPCASCQGHFEPTKFVLVRGATLARVELVGNYAFNLIWADGHDTGIYQFRKLRDLCPCKQCKPAGLEELRVLGIPQE